MLGGRNHHRDSYSSWLWWPGCGQCLLLHPGSFLRVKKIRYFKLQFVTLNQLCYGKLPDFYRGTIWGGSSTRHATGIKITKHPRPNDMQRYQDLKQWEIQILKIYLMDPIQNELGDSICNKPHEFWFKLTLNQWQSFISIYGSQGENSIWSLLLHIYTYTGKYLSYPYPEVINKEHKNKGGRLQLHLFFPKSYFKKYNQN